MDTKRARKRCPVQPYREFEDASSRPPAGTDARRGARHELVVDELPRCDELGGGRFAEHSHNVVQGRIDVAGRPGEPHQLGDDRQVDAAVPEVRIVRHRQIGGTRRRWSAATAVGLPHPRLAATAATGRLSRSVAA